MPDGWVTVLTREGVFSTLSAQNESILVDAAEEEFSAAQAEVNLLPQEIRTGTR